MNGLGSHCLLNRADETFAQAMTYLYLKSQSDDNIREEVRFYYLLSMKKLICIYKFSYNKLF